MPEYLAPAVYVEETSFRPKPIEGVSTSTTAFVGLCRRGPVTGTPELITSIGDFERIYGGTRALGLGAGPPLDNYLAHAMRAYFANGGSRLYLARVFQPRAGSTPGSVDPGIAASPFVVGNAAAPARARFVARFPGAAGNGTVRVIEQRAPAAWASMNRAQPGTMVRTGGGSPATPAVVDGQIPPFRVAPGAVLNISVNGTAHPVTFEGTAASVTAPAALPATVTLDATNNRLTVSIDGVAQVVTLPVGASDREVLALRINEALQGGFASLNADNELVIGSDLRGSASRVEVTPNATLGFTFAADSPDRLDEGTGTVPNLGQVTLADVQQLFEEEEVPLRLSLDPETRRIRLSTLTTGTGATIVVAAAAAGTPSAHTALGLAAGTRTGVAGATLAYFVKTGSQWLGDGGELAQDSAPTGGIQFVSMTVIATDADGFSKNFDDLAFAPEHPRYLGNVLAPTPPRRLDQLENFVALELTGAVGGLALRAGLIGNQDEVLHQLDGGNDGAPPEAERYREALSELEVLEDISIVAAPGATAFDNHVAIRDHVITHVERRRAYRIAVLDTPPAMTVGEARQVRSTMDSKYAALYYPWVLIANPDTRPGDESIPREIAVPPSGHVCGIYARNDVQRGVFKAPANEVVLGALRFETLVNMAHQETLNPEGVNALRTFPGRGHRVWGARLASSDPEWKYVNVRRYFNYVEHSIDRGTQWVVFEPNGEKLWERLRGTISDFLYAEWRGGALLGATPKEAYFVRCDRSTMTENDMENGRLICEVGISALKPAEFVIFRIGQKTASARS
jgi:uncharacterized protein